MMNASEFSVIIFVLIAAGLPGFLLAALAAFNGRRLSLAPRWWFCVPRSLVFARRGILASWRTPLIRLRTAPGGNLDEKKLIQTLYSLELSQKNPDDPIAQTTIQAGKANQITALKTEFFKETPGKGVSGIVGGNAVAFGSLPFMLECSVSCPPSLLQEAAHEETLGNRVLYAGWDGQVHALAVYQETLFENLENSAQMLRKAGIKKLILLTGAGEELAEQAAREAGADTVVFDASAEVKKEKIQEWAGQEKKLFWLEPRIPLNRLASHWARLNRLKGLARGILIVLICAAASLFFMGCERSPIATAGKLKGEIHGANPQISVLALRPNTVCYLIVKDRWDVPVIIKRWVNPRLPVAFELTYSDLLLPSRQWKGPYRLEAYLFASQNPKQELPPPPGAAKASTAELIQPGNSDLVILKLE